MFAVADLDELGWERSIEGPDGERTLGGQARVELGRDQASSTDARIQTGHHARVIDRVRLRAFLRHLDGDPGREIVESLVGPDGSWRAALDRTGVTRFDTFERGVEQLLGGIGHGGVLVRRRKYGGGYLGRVSPSLRRALVGKAQCAADRFGLQMHVRVSLLSASAGERLLCSFHWRSVLSGACSVVPSAMRADG